MRTSVFSPKSALAAASIAVSVLGLAACGGDNSDNADNAGGSANNDDVATPIEPKDRLTEPAIEDMAAHGCGEEYKAYLENLVRWNSMQSGGTWQDVTVDFKNGTAPDGAPTCIADVQDLGMAKNRGDLNNITITVMAADAGRVRINPERMEQASMLPSEELTIDSVRGVSNVMDSAFAKADELKLPAPSVVNPGGSPTQFVITYDTANYALSTGAYDGDEAGAWVVVETDTEQKGTEAAPSSASLLAWQVEAAVNGDTFTNTVYWEK